MLAMKKKLQNFFSLTMFLHQRIFIFVMTKFVNNENHTID